MIAATPAITFAIQLIIIVIAAIPTIIIFLTNFFITTKLTTYNFLSFY